MKLRILLFCAALSLVLGCKKEDAQVDRYKVFSATWEELSDRIAADGKLEYSSMTTSKELIKLDSATGRVWFWHREIHNGKDQCGWIEMTDSGYVLPASLQSKIK